MGQQIPIGQQKSNNYNTRKKGLKCLFIFIVDETERLQIEENLSNISNINGRRWFVEKTFRFLFIFG